MDIEAFRGDVIASANARAETIGCGLREGFVEETLDRLREAGEIPDWEPCAEKVDGPRKRRIEMDAVAFDEADDSVHLFLAMRDGGDNAPDTLTLTEVRDRDSGDSRRFGIMPAMAGSPRTSRRAADLVVGEAHPGNAKAERLAASCGVCPAIVRTRQGNSRGKRQ